MNVGYILLYRSFFENDFLYGDGHKFNKPEIWLWLLVYARWQDSPRSFLIRGNKVTINRGELAISEEELADTWHWSRPSIIKFLKEFEAENMIDVKRSRVINVIRIVNYERYQLNFLQQNLQQSLQQEKSCLQQEEPIKTNDVDENCINFLQQNLQQSLQQNLQQILQPINNSIINNISLSYNGETEKKFFEFLKRLDTQWKETQCRNFNINPEQLEASIAKFEFECQSNFDAHTSKEDLVKHFRSWLKIEMDKQKAKPQQPKQHNNGKSNNGYMGRGAYEPDPNKEYTGHFGD